MKHACIDVTFSYFSLIIVFLRIQKKNLFSTFYIFFLVMKIKRKIFSIRIYSVRMVNFIGDNSGNDRDSLPIKTFTKIYFSSFEAVS